MQADQIIEAWGLTEDDGGAPRRRVWRGCCERRDELDAVMQRAAGWHHVAAWDDGRYRTVWIDPAQRAIMTYCEGDIALVVLGSPGHYREELAACARFYGERHYRQQGQEVT